MFKLFSSIKDQKRKINIHGIGLGLVICQMIVKKFNGTIDFVSEFNKGSTFYYTFELEDICESDCNSNQRKESLMSIPSYVSKVHIDYKENLIKKTLAFQDNRILVADDEEFCIASMKAILDKVGIDTVNQVDFCINGKEALT